ncbi:hypothetical protein Syun_009349 [Stephania yunnanensis]|uniref:Acyl carrier protein n=1 Tax=Stephania yunnanensis TaxID=152371 RepID=A0AAP0KFE1_9MAGN
MAAAVAGNALFKHLWVNVHNSNACHPLFAFSLNLLRCHFSGEVRGSFIDKHKVTDPVISIVNSLGIVDLSKVTPNANFKVYLDLDSLDTKEPVMALEEEFGFEITDDEAITIDSVNHAVDFIASHPQAK